MNARLLAISWLCAGAALADASLTVPDGVRLRLTGYADLGFFKPQGDGVAYVRDVGHALHPELSGYPWVFLGDPWSNPINSQGDSADLGLDRTNVARFDPIRSGGKASFIVNTVNLGVVASGGEQFLFETSVNFEPRQGSLGSSGDNMDVDLAYLDWKPLHGLDLHVFAGKFESTFGIEYRRRKAPDRFGITPSIISRYTVGNPTGLKVRGSILGGLVTYNFAVTNGGMSTEKFAHFFNETARNDFKTLSGRLSLGGKIAGTQVELGASALYGAQALQSSDSIAQWQAGADLRIEVGDLAFRAEVLVSRAQGGGVGDAPSLRASGAYGELSYQLFAWLGAMVRADFRKARLFADPNYYLSDTGRFTAALRADITWNVIAKAEYLHVHELSGPQIPDDVFTSSLIFRF